MAWIGQPVLLFKWSETDQTHTARPALVRNLRTSGEHTRVGVNNVRNVERARTADGTRGQ